MTTDTKTFGDIAEIGATYKHNKDDWYITVTEIGFPFVYGDCYILEANGNKEEVRTPGVNLNTPASDFTKIT